MRALKKRRDSHINEIANSGVKYQIKSIKPPKYI